jgi:DNA-binding XRE family transcriptional regulator
MRGAVPSITLGGVEYVVVPRATFAALAGAELPSGAVDPSDARRRRLGARLRAAREHAGLTQAQLAGRIRRSQSMVASAEAGRFGVGGRYASAVLAACGLPADWAPARVARQKRKAQKKTPSRRSNARRLGPREVTS